MATLQDESDRSIQLIAAAQNDQNNDNMTVEVTGLDGTNIPSEKITWISEPQPLITAPSSVVVTGTTATLVAPPPGTKPATAAVPAKKSKTKTVVRVLLWILFGLVLLTIVGLLIYAATVSSSSSNNPHMFHHKSSSSSSANSSDDLMARAVSSSTTNTEEPCCCKRSNTDPLSCSYQLVHKQNEIYQYQKQLHDLELQVQQKYKQLIQLKRTLTDTVKQQANTEEWDHVLQQLQWLLIS